MERPPLPQGAQRRKDEQEIEWWGVEGGKRKQPKTQRKEGGPMEEELHPRVASKQAFWATTGRGGDSCRQVPSGLRAPGPRPPAGGRRGRPGCGRERAGALFLPLESSREQSPAPRTWPGPISSHKANSFLRLGNTPGSNSHAAGQELRALCPADGPWGQ